MRFKDRQDAGRRLAEQLVGYANRSDVIVLALPRGGVPVAAEVASRLAVPLDVFLVRKLGVPGHTELAMGAIADGGVMVLNEDLIRELRVPRPMIHQTAARERLELERRDRLYRGARSRPAVRDYTVILVDDGLATGSTMEAAVLALRQGAPAAIVVAVPVGSQEACSRLRQLADEVVCVVEPDWFDAVGRWYDNFAQTSDDEVRRALELAGRIVAPPIKGASPSDVVRARAIPLHGDPDQYDALMAGIGDARLVLLGEASHGTHEFYRERAYITRRLVAEKGFTAVAVEADWPDAYRINRYVRGRADGHDAVEALADFERFPAWMWRNADVLDFVGWLRTHNEAMPLSSRVGFYGLDLYSLHASMRAVVSYLQLIDPDAAVRAKGRYACFDRFGADVQHYGYRAGLGLTASCEREVIDQLRELRARAAEYASRDGRIAPDDFFFAEQNARVARNAEEYYRTMFGGHVESWNLRDRHMTETLAHLLEFLDRTAPGSRAVVWAHNSHLGDARATEMHDRGELNVGQLVRERYGAAAVLVGFSTFTGTVTAASEWDAPAERKQVRPALPGSYERMFHDSGVPRMLLPLRTDPDLAALLDAPRLERAIGVIYAPSTERASHYFQARLSRQFDYVLHFDTTRAVEPLERTAAWEAGEVAETYPSGY